MYFVCTTRPSALQGYQADSRYIYQKSPTYPRCVLIDTSVKIIYSKMDKQYINILHAPNRTWGYKAII